MKSNSKHLRTDLRSQIDRDSRFTPWMLVLVSIVLPILEGILLRT